MHYYCVLGYLIRSQIRLGEFSQINLVRVNERRDLATDEVFIRRVVDQTLCTDESVTKAVHNARDRSRRIDSVLSRRRMALQRRKRIFPKRQVQHVTHVLKMLCAYLYWTVEE